MTSPPKSDLEGTPSIINKRANRLPCYWITPGEYETLQVLYHKSSNFQVFTYINYCTWFLSRVFLFKKKLMIDKIPLTMIKWKSQIILQLNIWLSLYNFVFPNVCYFYL